MAGLITAGACPETISARRPGDLLVCLAGNPNVGKSTLFNQLTRAAVDTANYAGMTVELNSAQAEWAGLRLQVIDIPGTYSLDPVSEDQLVARRALLETCPDLVIAVIDATNLARNLYLALELLDLGFPLVVALNLVDEARRQRVHIDARRLSELLGVPVVPTVARTGEGLQELTRVAAERLSRPPTSAEAAASTGNGARPENPTAHGRAATAAEARWAANIAAARHRRAREIAEEVGDEGLVQTSDRIWRLTTSLYTGVPILLAVLAGTFGALFYVGGWLSNLLTLAWNASAGAAITAGVHSVFGSGVLGSTLLWGLNGGILAALAVAVPYILTFYLILALLEDSGYMNAAAFLTDRLMHTFGLHGRATIPLMAAAGCNVPAVMGTRVLSSKRERTIACTLVTLTPCSARTAVIVGAVSLYAGWQWALFVFGMVFIVGVLAGIGLNRMLPGQTDGMVMEMFPLRIPSGTVALKKTWKRFASFVWSAAPIILVGSIVLGALYETGLMWHLAAPLSPVIVGWLGLPIVAGLTLVFAVLRKELALQLLVVFAVARYGAGAHNLLNFMTPHQIVVYTLVNTLYIPCVATIAMLGRELGWRRAAAVSAGTVIVALLVGGLVARGLALI